MRAAFGTKEIVKICSWLHSLVCRERMEKATTVKGPRWLCVSKLAGLLAAKRQAYLSQLLANLSQARHTEVLTLQQIVG